jgi:hypothetical protein
MMKKLKSFRIVSIFFLMGMILASCNVFISQSSATTDEARGDSNIQNGERIYFTASSQRGDTITYQGGPNFGGMMMGSYLTCASCHGPEARGGLHMMHMQIMDAPDIRYQASIAESAEHTGDGHAAEEDEEYHLEDFRQAVIEGKHPDGDPISSDMPRWQMEDVDLEDLFAFLKSIP